MTAPHTLTVLCLASYEKGHEFLRQCKRQGCRVLLLTSHSLSGRHHFPMESIDEIFYMPDTDHKWNRTDTMHAVSYLARTESIDRLVPLDDFDLETAAALREHLRIPGMGETTTRYFRDKLAMRQQAREKGIAVPDFIHLLHHGKVAQFLEHVPGPWVLKPRLMAGAIGIKKIYKPEELWNCAQQLGDMQSYYLIERFVPGDIFHVDSIVYEGQLQFAIASQYGRPPLEVAHGGGIFTTRILPRESEISKRLLELNEQVLSGLGLRRGVSHTEYILGRDDGNLYFLETSARVGGANIAELIEAASGLNMWAEWAKVEIAGGHSEYHLPEQRQEYAGLIVSLARQEHPDTSAYNDGEIVWRMDKRHHVGLIVRSAEETRIRELLDQYLDRVQYDFHAALPPKETASE